VEAFGVEKWAAVETFNVLLTPINAAGAVGGGSGFVVTGGVFVDEFPPQPALKKSASTSPDNNDGFNCSKYVIKTTRLRP